MAERKKQSPKRLSNAFFTYNNPSKSLEDYGEHLKTKARYFKIQMEKGAQGTEHIQGVVWFRNQVKFATAKSFLGERVHLEPVQSWPDAIEYCGKEDTRVAGPIVWGTPPAAGTRTDLTEIASKVIEGTALKDIATDHPAHYVRYHRGLQALRGRVATERDYKTRVIVLTGPSGCGKTSSAYAMLHERGTTYIKRGKGKWWDGYDRHENVLWDEFQYEDEYRESYLALFDRYPHYVEVKGGFTPFVARIIILTCIHYPFGGGDFELDRRITIWIDQNTLKFDRTHDDEEKPETWSTLIDVMNQSEQQVPSKS